MSIFDTLLGSAQALEGDLRLALHAAAAGGEIVAAGYGKLAEVEAKGVGDLVSQVDLDADRAIAACLSATSQWPILSEELASGQSVVDNLWIVDPLDASSAFLLQAGREYPSVLVALRRDGELALGVAFFPLSGDWYFAAKGKGAWHNGNRLVCDCNAPLGEVWVEMNQYGDAALETEYFAEMRRQLRSRRGARLVTCNVPNSGVAMRIARSQSALAAAVHDNNPASVKQAAWDIAAPQIILEEAGGVFLNPRGQRTDPFVTEPIIVARSRTLADRLLQLMPGPVLV